jgi:hypothetical protein
MLPASFPGPKVRSGGAEAGRAGRLAWDLQVFGGGESRESSRTVIGDAEREETVSRVPEFGLRERLTR